MSKKPRIHAGCGRIAGPTTYAGLLLTTRYAAAVRFFLDELYGPSSFTQRDAQFARVVPALVRLCPREIVETVATLAELHALSESLDTTMAKHLGEIPVNAIDYIRPGSPRGEHPTATNTRSH